MSCASPCRAIRGRFRVASRRGAGSGCGPELHPRERTGHRTPDPPGELGRERCPALSARGCADRKGNRSSTPCAETELRSGRVLGLGGSAPPEATEPGKPALSLLPAAWLEARRHRPHGRRREGSASRPCTCTGNPCAPPRSLTSLSRARWAACARVRRQHRLSAPPFRVLRLRNRPQNRQGQSCFGMVKGIQQWARLDSNQGPTDYE